jgi:hypothetical protein
MGRATGDSHFAEWLEENGPQSFEAVLTAIAVGHRAHDRRSDPRLSA